MITVVKIGGNVIDDPVALESFIREFHKLESPKILVHGGGKEATRLSATLGIETKMIDGRRVTDRATLDVVTMVYAGLINKRIVSLLQAGGTDAVGLTGADGNLMPAARRPATPVDYGHVGDIDPLEVNDSFIGSLLDAGKVPVLCAICHDGKGGLLNCNADSVAAAAAAGASRIGDTRLIYCFEKAGVLTDVNDDSSLIPLVTEETFGKLKENGTVAAGMLPKIANALASVRQGVSSVRICRADALNTGAGTEIR